MQTLSSYLESKGSILKRQGSEIITRCLFCDDNKNHLYINDEKGVFFCHKCSEAGNIWRLKKHFGELDIKEYSKKEYKKPKKDTDKDYTLQLSAEGKEYLTKLRGLGAETIAHFKIGQYQDFIAIPYYKDKELVNFKYRKMSEKAFQRFKDGESTLFNVDNVDRTKDILITEGEIDAMSCWQMGYTNVISVTVGAGSFNPDWIDFFDSCTGTFFVAFDNDKAGDEGAEKLIDKIGRDRTRRVKLPLKDFNDCLMGGFKKEDIDEWVGKAEHQGMENLVHISEVYQRLDDVFQRKDRGCGKKVDGWDDFNERMGGLRESEMTVLTGDTGSGKSTFALNIFYNLIKQGESILIASTEMDTEQVISSLFSMHIGKNFKDFSADEYAKCIMWFSEKKIYFVDVHGRLSVNQIEDYICYAKRKYDISFVLLDHLHFFIRYRSENPVVDIENFVFDIVGVAKKTKCNIWLIAHPSKLDNRKGLVSMNDIKGSSAIKQDAHNVLTIRRDREAEEKGFNEVIINIEKVRHTSGKGGKKRYLFNSEGLSYEAKPTGDGISETFDDGQSTRAYGTHGYSSR